MAFVTPSFGTCIFGFDLTLGEQKWVVSIGDVGPDGAITTYGQPLYHNGVLYTSVERLWALDATTGEVLSFASERAYNTVGSVIHYANGEILVWGDELTAYKPIR